MAGATFREFRGLRPAADTFLIGTGLMGNISDNTSAYLNYDFEFKDEFNSHTVSLGIRFQF